jgi:crossover junction endodeoxyribonuclease RusA
MNITLPWPDRDLWTNAKKRTHWRVVSARTAEARQAARATAASKLCRWPSYGKPTSLQLIFTAPTRRRYDVANALEACKPYIDGVCDAMGIDDSVFTQVCCNRCEPDKARAGVVIVVAA